jgi:uncharacterized membrane protein YraQ (UPF0718 family)
MNNAFIFIAISVILTGISFILDKKKTISGLKKGYGMFKGIAVPFLNILVLVSLFLYIIPPAIIVKYLGAGSGVIGLAIAALVGSISLIPAFISYPIAAGLIRQGASYTTVATFMTTLMMVGVITFPLEARYFGRKTALIRNLLNFLAALVIGIVVGLIL